MVFPDDHDGPRGEHKSRQENLQQREKPELHSRDETLQNGRAYQMYEVSTRNPSAMSIDTWPTDSNLEGVGSQAPASHVDRGGGAIVGQFKGLARIISKPGTVKKQPENMAHQDADTMAMNYTAQIRQLIRSSGIYALSSFASPLVSLVLAPFLTRHLSHADYGALVILNTVIALVAGVSQLGLNSAFFRSYNYDYESPRDRSDVLSAVVLLLSCVSLPVSIAMIIEAPWLATLLFNSPALTDPMRLAGVVILLQNLTVPGFAWLRAENRSVFFVVLAIANLLVNLCTTLVLVGVFQMGISGSLIALGAGYAVVMLSTLPLILWRVGLHLRFDIVRGLLTFGLPNVSSFVSVWVLQLADRFLLARLGSLSQTASYSVAYSLGSVLNVVVVSPFLLAWPTALFTIAKGEDAQRIFQLLFRWFSVGLLFATYALSLVATFMLYLLFPPGYHSAAPIIPIIAVAIMFNGVYNFVALGIGIRRKTWYAFLRTTISACVNVALNLVLIPLYGSMGAALATFLAYFLLALLCYIVNQHIYPVPFEIDRFMFALSVGVVLYAISGFLVQNHTTFVVWGIAVCGIVLYGGCLVILAKVPARSPGNT